jgi:ABC-type antimicrobial peptide transport system permease subunit
VLRASRPATNIDERLREAVWSIDATVPLRSVEAMATQFRDHTAETRFRSFLVVTFATLAGFLAMLGIYAVLAISVARRTREIGIRVALGATGADLHRAVLARGMRLVAAGGALGLVAALLTGRVLASMLYELAPADPVTLTSVLLLTLFAAFLACWVPAYRASRVDPVRSLQRDEWSQP